jgi:hypothetical protein
MTAVPQEPSVGADRRPRSAPQFATPDVWPSLAITVMWIAVVVDAVWGPDIVSSTPGSTSSTVPSAVVLALFAFLGSWAVARYGFGRSRRD